MKLLTRLLPHLPAVLFFLLFGGCKPNSTQQETKQQQPASPEIQIPHFNADSAYAFVKEQCDFGPRVPNTKAHADCAAYLISKLKSYTPNVLVQTGQVTTFNKITLNIQNIIGQFNPSAKNRVLLFAHWDTRPWADQDSVRKDEPILGADDGASGVAVLLEVARLL